MVEKMNLEKQKKTTKAAPQKVKKINEFIYFAIRNNKLKVGMSIVLLFLILTIVGPFLTDYELNAFTVGPASVPPSSEYWFGTTTFGQDVYTQFVYGLRATFMVGVIGGGLATFLGLIIGFTAGYRGGIVDELLNMLTNIVLVIPAFAILLIIAAYLKVRGVVTESILIGFINWTWTARAVRAQTFSLRSREFIDMARISGMKPLKIIFTEIAPNMMSYLLMAFILQFGGAILFAATLDFIGLGPTQGISLGLMMNYAVLWGALQLGSWWWFIPPGFAIMAIVGSLYIMNVGLDEVFNPKLREF
jgi:peptide/nickel transport system permease protein